MIRRSVFIALGIVGCAGTVAESPFDLIVSEPGTVSPAYETLADIEYITRRTYSAMTGLDVRAPELGEIRYTFTPAPIPCPSGTCSGVTTPIKGGYRRRWDVVVTVRGCLATSALIHELIHLYELWARDDINASHLDRDDLKIFYSVGSIQAKAEAIAIQKGLCK